MVKWVKPNLKDEREEIAERAVDLSVPSGMLASLIEKGDLTTLTAEIWSRLQNTDSSNHLDLEEAKHRATGYDKDWEPLLKSMQEGGPIPAPIVVKLDDDSYYLVAGNTRLMFARALGLRPEVLMVTLTRGKSSAMWSVAMRKAQSLKNKSSAYFDKQDWGFVNHLYHKLCKSELPVDQVLMDRVASSSYWNETAETYTMNLFNLYRRFSRLVGTQPTTATLRTRYATSYALLVREGRSAGIINPDAESYQNFIAGYEDYANSLELTRP